MFKKLFKSKDETQEQEVLVHVYELSDVEQLRNAVQNSNHDQASIIPHFNDEHIATFEQLLNARLQAFLEDEDNEDDFEDAQELYALKMDLATRLYLEVMPQATTGEQESFVIQYGSKLQGIKTYQNASPQDSKQDTIHGIDFKAYAKANFKLAENQDMNAILTSLNVTLAQWEEASNAFLKQMMEDTSGNLAILYSQYMIPDAPQDQPLLDDRTYFQDVYAYFLSANELGLDGEKQTIEKFHHTNFELQQALQAWTQKDAVTYEEYILSDAFFSERCAFYKREFETKSNKPNTLPSFDLKDFGKQSKLLEVDACIQLLDASHPLRKILQNLDEDEVEDYGNIVLFQGNIDLAGDFSTVAQELFKGNEDLEDEEIGMVAILGDINIEKNATIDCDFFVEGNFSANSIQIFKDDEPQQVTILKDCKATIGLFIQNTILQLTIQSTLATPLVFSAIEEGKTSVAKVANQTLGICGYLDDDELGSSQLLKSLNLSDILSVDKLNSISNFDDDPSATEDIIGDFIDGSIVLRNV